MNTSIRILLVLLLALGSAVPGATKPNVLIILADDLGYGDLGFTGSKEISTPHLDSLAENGVVCRNGYVTHAYCGPSRAGLITGRHQARFGMEINATYSPYDLHMGLPVEEKTFATRLKKADYHTGIIGKWHLGAATPFHPNNRGFDYFYGFLSGGRGYWPEDTDMLKPLLLPDGTLNYGANEGCFLPLVRNNNTATLTGYLTTALSRDAARFVTESKKPFCLFLSYNAPHAPHAPLQAPKETVGKYGHIKDLNRRIYAAMIDEMDRGIGMVIDALKESGKFDDTLIFFLSDNGGVAGPPWNPKENWANNAPFKRGKTSMHEGGNHVPYLVHWPNGLQAGTYDGLVSSLDITATAVALAGGDTSGRSLDGVNLIPFLTGEKEGSPHAALFWRDRGSKAWAVRTPTAKYLCDGWGGHKKALYDMTDDPYESTNILEQAPEQRAALARLWNQWNADNMENVLLHAYDYQKERHEFYEKLFQKLKAEAATTKPAIIE